MLSLDWHLEDWGPVAAQVWAIVNTASGDMLNVILALFLAVGCILALLNVARGSDNF